MSVSRWERPSVDTQGEFTRRQRPMGTASRLATLASYLLLGAMSLTVSCSSTASVAGKQGCKGDSIDVAF